jgi:nascent polypeptide-associated complex subunit alpha
MMTISTPSSNSPIKEDPKLQKLLEKLDSANSNQQFHRPTTGTIVSAPSHGKDEPKQQKMLNSVNSKFLKEFEAYLDDADKTAKAELIFADFVANLAKLTKLLKQLQGFLENGSLTADTCTVKARHCLTEVGRQTTVGILQIEALMPGTSAEKKKAGYTKVDIGAALIRDDFVQYGRLLACTEVLEHFRTKTCLEQGPDRLILQTMEQHGIKARIFCDIMTDLGVFKEMTRCRDSNIKEMDNSAGALKPNKILNENPALPAPRRPKPSKMMQKYKDAIQDKVHGNSAKYTASGNPVQTSPKASRVSLLSSEIDSRISVSLFKEPKESEQSGERQVTQESLESSVCVSIDGETEGGPQLLAVEPGSAVNNIDIPLEGESLPNRSNKEKRAIDKEDESDQEVTAAEMPAVALVESPEASVPVPAATSSASTDSTAEKVVGDTADAAEDELDDSETPSPSVTSECEALEGEKELTPTPQPAADTETVVFASESDQEVKVAEMPAVASEHLEASVSVSTATSSASVDSTVDKVLGDQTDAVEEALGRFETPSPSVATEFEASEVENELIQPPIENTETFVYASESDQGVVAAEIPAVPLEHAETLAFVDSTAEKVVGDTTDPVEEELDDSENPSPSVAAEFEASEIEKELTPQPAEDTETVVFASVSDQEVTAAEIPAVASEQPEASVPVPTATSSASIDLAAERVVGDAMDAADEEVEGSETPSPSVATECEALEVEKESTPQPAEDNETIVLADNGSDQNGIAAEVPAESKQNRNEKKSRIAMRKLGMRPVPGILRVTIKKSLNAVFVINQPDVFKSPTMDTYVVFGEAKGENTLAASQAAAAMQFQQQVASIPSQLAAAGMPNLQEVEEGVVETVEGFGLESKDIDLVMSQAGCSRAVAVAALEENDGDLVNSIMSLTN